MERVSVSAARVRAGKVEIQRGEAWVPADDVIIMGQAAGDSEGVVLVGQHGARYFTNTQLDAAYLLGRLADVADKIADLGSVNSWIISADNQIKGQNADAAAIGQQAAAIADELREYKLK